jgi:hypothetical protein
MLGDHEEHRGPRVDRHAAVSFGLTRHLPPPVVRPHLHTKDMAALCKCTRLPCRRGFLWPVQCSRGGVPSAAGIGGGECHRLSGRARTPGRGAARWGGGASAAPAAGQGRRSLRPARWRPSVPRAQHRRRRAAFATRLGPHMRERTRRPTCSPGAARSAAAAWARCTRPAPTRHARPSSGAAPRYRSQRACAASFTGSAVLQRSQGSYAARVSVKRPARGWPTRPRARPLP